MTVVDSSIIKVNEKCPVFDVTHGAHAIEAFVPSQHIFQSIYVSLIISISSSHSVNMSNSGEYEFVDCRESRLNLSSQQEMNKRKTLNGLFLAF